MVTDCGFGFMILGVGSRVRACRLRVWGCAWVQAGALLEGSNPCAPLQCTSLVMGLQYGGCNDTRGKWMVIGITVVLHILVMKVANLL